MRYVVFAIPAFLFLIAVEALLVRGLGRSDYYSLPDSIADLGTGLLSQLFETGLKFALFAGYVRVYETHRALDIAMGSAGAWVLCFLGVDFLYYWFHRASHETNAFWAAHVVHHQSEEFNLAVALRQGTLQAGLSWAFYLPLAWLGFPPAMFLVCASANTLYQFWIHTRLIGKLGPLEWVFNTPSNHRVHHARNPRYIDRNHGGTLIVWDRLFGTYAEEREEPVYGITTPLRSWNPVWANAAYWVELGGRVRRARRLRDRLRLLVARPGWRPDDMGGFQAAPEVDPRTALKFRGQPPPAVLAYVVAQFVVTLMAGSAVLFGWDGIAGTVRAGAVGCLVLALLAGGGMLDQRAWAPGLEWARLALLVPAAALLGPRPALAAAVFAAVSGAWLGRARVRPPTSRRAG